MTDFTKESISKIRFASECGKSSDVKNAVYQALEDAESIRNWKGETREWILNTIGHWSVSQCYGDLGAKTVRNKDAVRRAICDFKKEGIIEPYELKGYGWYKKLEKKLEEMDWRNAPTECIKIKLPLELSEMTNLYNGDIFVIAGESNVGKTSFCLNIIELNMEEWDCCYFSSELGPSRLKKRISLFDIPEDLWRMLAYDRHDNYHEVLVPNAINIIDFLMVTEDFWRVGNQIKKIHFALKELGGIAVIAIQKSPYKEFGRGGDITMELANLYLTLSRPGRARIVKLKDWATETNPNQKVCDYSLINGSRFFQSTPWHYPEDEGELWKNPRK